VVGGWGGQAQDHMAFDNEENPTLGNNVNPVHGFWVENGPTAWEIPKECNVWRRITCPVNNSVASKDREV